jgi:hypothetical protein
MSILHFPTEARLLYQIITIISYLTTTLVFDTEAAETAAVGILYTLSDIDEFARANPKERFMGYISVLITELNLVLNYKRNMLMSTECCGMPLFANAVAAKCRQCEKMVPLRINPKIVSRTLFHTSSTACYQLR